MDRQLLSSLLIWVSVHLYRCVLTQLLFLSVLKEKNHILKSLRGFDNKTQHWDSNMGHQTQTLLQFRTTCIPGLNQKRGNGMGILGYPIVIPLTFVIILIQD